MKEHHDVPLIGHVGVHRTVDHIKRAFWSKGLWGDIGQHVRSCLVCQLMKLDHKKKAGLLQPLAEAQINLALAQKQMSTGVNRSRRSVEYNVG